MAGYFVKVSEMKEKESKEKEQAEKFRVLENITCQWLSINKLGT